MEKNKKGSEVTNLDRNNLHKVLITGQTVGLDMDLANSSKVRVVRQTPKRLYTTVTVDGEYCWEVMTYRLTSL
jgi:hypothetical protein